MKKILTLSLSLLLVALLLSFVGCQKSENPPTIDEENSVIGANEFSRGVVESSTYKSEYIGIGCTLDSSWTFYSDEEIAELNGATKEQLGSDVQEVIDEAEILYDMFAINSTVGDNISVNFEAATPEQIENLDIRKNLEAVAATLEANFASLGLQSFSHEIKDVEIDGKTIPVLYSVSDMNGINIYQIMLSVKCSEHLANIGITSYMEDATSDYLGNFYWLD